MLELAVLGLLNEQPLHGYELKKRLSETLGPLWGDLVRLAVPGAPRLERDGAIEAIEAAEPTAPRAASADRFARRRPRRGPASGAGAPRRAAAPARRTASPSTGAALLRASCSTDDSRRRRAHLRPEARVLPPPRPRPAGSTLLERRRAAAHRSGSPTRRAAGAPARIDRYTPVAPRAPHPVHRNTTSRGSTS